MHVASSVGWRDGTVCGDLPELGHAPVTENTFKLAPLAIWSSFALTRHPIRWLPPALNFCHGFAVGVFRVLDEEKRPRNASILMFCAIPDGPSRAHRRSLISCNGPKPIQTSWRSDRPTAWSAYLVKTFPVPDAASERKDRIDEARYVHFCWSAALALPAVRT